MLDSQPAPRVSVISAWYNRPEDLELSVRSILDQEGVDFEYIVVDDASTDPETLRGLEAISDPRFHLVRLECNGGFTRAMQHAASLARGEFIAVHDAGDISRPGRLAAQVAFMDEHEDHVAVGVIVENHVLATGRRHLMSYEVPKDYGIDGVVFTHGEVMYSRADYEAVGGYRSIFYYAQDNDLWRRLIERGKLGHVKEVLYERRVFADGVSGDARKEVAQAIYANLSVAAHQDRRAGHPDPVGQKNSLALLSQPRLSQFERRGTASIKRLLQERRFADARAALGIVPAGLMTWKMLTLYVALVILLPSRRKRDGGVTRQKKYSDIRVQKGGQI